MARLYSNENFPLPVVDELRVLGHDVLTSFESGNANLAIPDEQVLAFASAQNRILITVNRKDFIRLHRRSPTHAGIIACTLDNDFAGLASRIHRALVDQPNMNGSLVRVNRPNE